MFIFRLKIFCDSEKSWVTKYWVSSLNATDKKPMHEMPLIFVFGGWGFGVGGNIYCNGVLGVGVLTLALCLQVTILPFLQALPVAIR